MHRFKFRAWHTGQKRMIDVYGLGPDFLTENTFDGVDPGTNAFDGEDMSSLKVMQFTGDRDKDKVNIYEGDVLMRPGMPYVFVEWYQMKFVARHDQKASRGIVEWRQDLDQLLVYKSAIVIGNIYENPELLKGVSYG